MRLIEQIHLKPSPELYNLCHLCKSLYNLGNYYINMNYETLVKYLNWYDTKWMLKISKPFKELPSQVAQNVLKSLHLAWKSYFSAIKDWKKNPGKYRCRPKPPKYLKKDGEYIACFNHQHIRIKNGYLHFPKKANLEPIEVVTKQEELQQVRIIPKSGIYNLELIYEREISNLGLDPSRMIGIDIGLDNLACVVNNIGLKPFVINGRPLKSINHYYNKKKMHFQSIKDKQGIQSNTKKLRKLEYIRLNKIGDYMHKATRHIINYCIENNIGTVVIGHNNGWKQSINIGKKNNQNFVQIPFNMLMEKIQYKAELIGINVICDNESYTSKCSFLDNEEIKFHEKYLGKRIKRGLFKASDGIIINADVNGAYNILKKAFPNTFTVDGIQGAQLHPIRINLNTKSKLTHIKKS